MPNLYASYSALQTNLFVKVSIDQYRTTAGGSYISKVLKFSDNRNSFDIDGETYIGLGNLMSVTNSSSELRVSSGELTIVVSGIPNSSISEIIHSRIKGSPVAVYRAFFDPVTGGTIPITGPFGRFVGFVNNYSLQEDYDIESRTATNTLALICNSSVDVLQNKVTGRRTNPRSQKTFYPSDLSMDRVPTLKNATFDFGAKQ